MFARLRSCDWDYSSHDCSRKEHGSSWWFGAQGGVRRRVTRAGGGSRGPKHKGSGGGVGVEGKGSEGKGQAHESASLAFVVQMLVATVGEGEAPDWWAGLNCKVHFWLVADAAARLWTVTQGRGWR